MSTTTSYAEALNEAKSLIIQQSNRIKGDAEKLRKQSQEIGQLRATTQDMSQEISRLQTVEHELSSVSQAKDQAEAMVGRQRVQIDSLESSGREMQRVLGEQAERIADLSRELESMREQLPTEADEAALSSLSTLLESARRGRSGSSSESSGSGDGSESVSMRRAA